MSMAMSVLLTVPAFATTGEWNTAIADFGRIYQTLCLCGGAVGIAWCALEYAYGSERQAQKAGAKALIIAASVAALILLPHIIRLGKSLGEAYKWDPNTLA